MMTTLAALFSTLPIALGLGAGADARQASRAWRSCGGLVVSQLVTLYLTPVVYIYLEALQSKLSFRERKLRKPEHPLPTEREPEPAHR